MQFRYAKRLGFGFQSKQTFQSPIFGVASLVMSTLAEIETAADALPPEQKEELLRFLAMRLRKERPQAKPRVYSDQEISAMLAEDEADGARLRQNG